MRILLFNQNPVVSKLVGLSSKKTEDELTRVGSLEEITQEEYELVLVDDGVNGEGVIDELKAKVTASKYIYIVNRDNSDDADLDEVIKKPFLPTDMVEMLARISLEVSTPANKIEEAAKEVSLDTVDDLTDDEGAVEDSDEFTLSESIDDPIILDNETADDEIGDILDGVDSFQTEIDGKVDNSLDEEESLLEEPQEIEDLEEDSGVEPSNLDEFSGEDSKKEEYPLDDDEDSSSESVLEEEANKKGLEPEVLDRDELEEVQNLLDESYDDPFDRLDDELDLLSDDPLGEEELGANQEDERLEDEIDDISLDENTDNSLDVISEEELSPIEQEDEGETKLPEEIEEISDEFDSLSTEALGEALGEDILEDAPSTDDAQINSPSLLVSADGGLDTIKGLIQKLESDDIKRLLDGMEMNIKITFNKANE